MKFEITLPHVEKTVFSINSDTAPGSVEKFNMEASEYGLRSAFKGLYATDFMLLDGAFRADKNMQVTFETISPCITVLFVFKSDDSVRHQTEQNETNMQPGVIHIFYTRYARHDLNLSHQKGIRCYSLLIGSAQALSLFENDYWLSHILYKKIAQNVEIPFGEISLSYNRVINDVFYELFSSEISEKIKKQYLFLKIQELFLLLFNEMDNQHQKPQAIHDEVQRKIIQARAYLTINYVAPPTIKELSRIIALNELKLKTGFKNMFGITLYRYVIMLRMEKAQKLLAERKKSITDISYELGYSSVSHFIQKFKEYHGVTPKQYPKNT